MGVVFQWWLCDIAAIFVSLFVLIYIYFKVRFNYWKSRGIPYLRSTFPFGNIADVMFLRKQIGETFTDIYNRLDGHKYGGVFQLHRPTLVLRDPEVIKDFLVKDFSHFHDRGMYFDEENDPLQAHLFLLPGQKWRNLRAKLTPTFTSGKMRMMFQTILDCGNELQDCVKSDADHGSTIEIKEIVARFSTDVIASCAFGIQCNSLKNPNAEFRVKGKEFIQANIVVIIGFFLNVMAPTIGAIVNLGRIPKKVSDFFINAVRETVEYREKNDVVRNDFMQLLMQLKNKGYVDVDGASASSPEQNRDALKKLTLDEIAAQAFVFFVAGFETSSTTVSFCMYELALNPDVQTRLRQEIDEVVSRHEGQVTYDAVHEMEYLDRVVAETLRKYPSLPILNRECTVAHKLEDEGAVLAVGTQVVIPVLALQHDPQHFPEPQRFDPERFTAEAKAARHHYAYLPFGEGPRMCIGMRFGLMQTKIAILSLLSKYEFKVSKQTAIPLVLDARSFTMAAAGGIFLQIVNREE